MRELHSRVQNVGTNGASNQRMVAYLFELLILADVERQCDDLRTILVSQQRNRFRIVIRTRVRENDALHHALDNFSSRLTSARARRASGATARMVSSPATVPTTSGRRAPSSATPSSCACPGPVRMITSCCT